MAPTCGIGESDWCQAAVTGLCQRVAVGALLGTGGERRVCQACLLELLSEAPGDWMLQPTGVQLASPHDGVTTVYLLWLPDVVTLGWVAEGPRLRQSCDRGLPPCTGWAEGTIRGGSHEVISCRACLGYLAERQDIPDDRVMAIVCLQDGAPAGGILAWVPDRWLTSMRTSLQWLSAQLANAEAVTRH